MIFHPLWRAAVGDLPQRVARIEVDGRDAGPWWFDDGQSLKRWRHAGRADHLDVGLARLGLFHAVYRGVRPSGGPDVQESGLGIDGAAFPIHAAGTREGQSAF